MLIEHRHRVDSTRRGVTELTVANRPVGPKTTYPEVLRGFTQLPHLNAGFLGRDILM